MALPQITSADFKGFYKLALNEFKIEDLDGYTSMFIEENVRQILGDAVFSDMANQDFQKWTDINNGVDFTDSNGVRRHLTALTELLIGFIYFEYVRDNFTTTVVGKVKGKSENSERSTSLEVAGVARSRYNKKVCDFNKSMELFLDVYESISSVVSASFDLNNNSYVLSILDPVYLNTGTTINIEEESYAVTELLNFTIDAGATGLDFTGQTATWNFSSLVSSSDNTSGTLYQLLVGDTQGLSVGQTVNVGGTDYTVLDLVENTCFTIDGGATGLDFTGETAAWSFNTQVTVSVDLNDNTYLLAVADSTYVSVGSNVEINAVQYVILSTESNYLIDAGATGLDFTSLSVTWEPFSELIFKEAEIVGL